MNRTKLIAALSVLATIALSTQAQSLYWDTNSGTAGLQGGNGTWNSSTFWNPASNGSGTAQNWSDGSNAVFGSGSTDATSSTVDLQSTAWNVGQLSINNKGATTTLSGGSISLSGGISFNNNNGDTKLNAPITLAGAQTFNFFGNGITQLQGTLDLGVYDLQITAVNQRNAVSANLSGSGDITISSDAPVGVAGQGTVLRGVEFSGSNSGFTGDYVINKGVIGVFVTSGYTANSVIQYGNTADAKEFFLYAGSGSTPSAATVGGLNSNGGAGAEYVSLGNSRNGTLTIDTSVTGGGFGFGGIIQELDETKTLSLVKTGAGIQTLSGNNTYNGTTSVTGGSLLINGSHVTTTAGATYSVTNADSTLGGSGRIAVTGAATIGSGAILAPGAAASIESLTLDGVNNAGNVLTMSTGAKFAFTLAGNGGTPDQLDFWNYVSGDLALNSNVIDLTLSGTEANGTYTVDLFRFFSDGGSTATTHAFASGLTIGTLGANIDSASIDWDGSLNDNTTIALTYTVIPEPSTLALFGLAGVAVVMGMRRRRG